MKFRVWDKHTKTMHHDSFALTPNERLLRVVEYTDWDYEEVTEEDFEVMFSTGVNDRDGTSVFFGDILSQDIGEKELATVLVDEEWVNEFQWYSGIHSQRCETLKVLGNKWQNPELLEKSDG